MLEIVAATYVIGALLAGLGVTGFVVWDRWHNGTPWSWFTYSTRLILVVGAWPLFLLAFGVVVREIRRKPPTNV